MSAVAQTASTVQSRMVELMLQLAPAEGYTQSLLDGVTYMRSNRSIPATQALYEPSIVIVVQGRKKGFHGGSMYVYDEQNYLVLSVPLPFSIETEANEDAPLLGLALRIDPQVTMELALSLDDPPRAVPPTATTMYATPIDTKLADATLRLLDALCSPSDTKLLGPAIFREITYRVLTGEQGVGLRAALAQTGHFGRIAKVLRKIHSAYHDDLDVPALADQANMSVPAFHTHFKAVTATSPIQYIKAIRLHEARLMIVRNGVSAATASERVGYESTSQFSREFKRMFGRSPMEESRHLKAVLSLSPALALAH